MADNFEAILLLNIAKDQNSKQSRLQVRIAQSVRALRWHCEGRELEPRYARFFVTIILN